MGSELVRAALCPFCRWVLVAANRGNYIISPNPFIHHLGTSYPFTAAPCDGRNPRDTRRGRPDLRYTEHQHGTGERVWRHTVGDSYVSRLCVGMRGQWHRAQTASRCRSLVPGTRALEMAACTMRKGVRVCVAHGTLIRGRLVSNCCWDRSARGPRGAFGHGLLLAKWLTCCL